MFPLFRLSQKNTSKLIFNIASCASMRFEVSYRACGLVIGLIVTFWAYPIPAQLGPNSQVPPADRVIYHAYGDSITYGFRLPQPRRDTYAALAASREWVTEYANYAIPGQEACDVADMQIAANHDSPSLGTHPYYTLLIGTNDVHEGDFEHLPAYLLCLRGALSWLAMPTEFKVLAGGPEMAHSGHGEIESDDNWIAWLTEAKDASVTFRIATNQRGPIYIWPRVDADSEARYTCALDQHVIGEFAVNQEPTIRTKNGTTRSLGLIRIGDVTAGRHTVTVTQTSDGDVGVAIVGIGAPSQEVSGTLPTVLVGTIPYQYHENGSGTCTLHDAICWAFVRVIRNSVDLLRMDGLNVKVFDTRKYMLGSASEMTDPLHPNVLGHEEIGRSLEEAW